jgi:hypothetical protein
MSDFTSLDDIEGTLREALDAIQEKLKPLGGKSGVVDDLRQALLGLVAHVRHIDGRISDMEDRLDELEEAADAADEDEDEDEDE